MAGGPFAAVVACDVCRWRFDRWTVAERIYEGSENDQYRCAEGHTFGIHWRSIPDHPMWPPTAADEAVMAAQIEAQRRG